MQQQQVSIILKSGYVIDVTCESVEFSYDKETLEYTGYRFVGRIKPKAIGIVPSQIAAWIQVK